MRLDDTSAKPLILAVERDDEHRTRLEEELTGRYGGHYRVICVGRGKDARDELRRTLEAGHRVPLVLAAQDLDDDTGVGLLREVKALDPSIKRGLLISWGDWGREDIAEAIVGAMTRGLIDYYVLKPWQSPDEFFHRTVTGFLHEWVRASPHGPARISVVGRPGSRRSHELCDLLSRQRVENAFYASDSTEGKRILGWLGSEPAGLPVVVTPDGRLLVDPSDAEVAHAFGLQTHLDDDRDFDVVVIGAGPAGLAAAVYGASEGLRTLVVERGAVGGQAGSSSLIRNYLGFARGISGSELAAQAYQQAWVFGTKFLMTQSAEAIARRSEGFELKLSGGTDVYARAVVLATGVSYRRLGVPGLEALLGAGVFYGASVSEAVALGRGDVYVVGGGNSAGQAALHLAKHAGRVSILVRSESLAGSMSDYLVREIEAASNIELRRNTQIVDGGGVDRLEYLVLEERTSGRQQKVYADALFVLIGAKPFTDWMPDEIERDPWGYVLTGEDVSEHRREQAERSLLLETSVPGIFAVGDVRHGSIKRVASAVGEGSIAIKSVHERLQGVPPRHSGKPTEPAPSRS